MRERQEIKMVIICLGVSFQLSVVNVVEVLYLYHA